MEQQTTIYAPLEAVTAPVVNTAAAAFYLNRKPQTLRHWAAFEDGPLRPRRINGRLAWPVADLRRLCGLDPKEVTNALATA